MCAHVLVCVCAVPLCFTSQRGTLFLSHQICSIQNDIDPMSVCPLSNEAVFRMFCCAEEGDKKPGCFV